MRGTRALACLAAVVSLALLVVPATALPHHMHMRAARAMRRGAAGCAPHAAGAPRWLHAPHGALTLRGGAGHEAETVRGVLAIIVAIFAEVTFVRLCGPAAGPQPLGGAHARERARPCGPGPEDAGRAWVPAATRQVELFGKISKHRVLPPVVTRKLAHIFTGSSMLTLFYLFPVGHSCASTHAPMREKVHERLRASAFVNASMQPSIAQSVDAMCVLF